MNVLQRVKEQYPGATIILENVTYIDSSELYPQNCDAFYVIDHSSDLHEHLTLENGKILNAHWEEADLYNTDGNTTFYDPKTFKHWRVIRPKASHYFQVKNGNEIAHLNIQWEKTKFIRYIQE